jgi:hypothetical protein
LRESVVQGLLRVLGRDRARAGEQHRPGIEAGVHLHDGDAGGVVAGLDRTRNRRRPAPARQQRGVHVEAAVLRNCQNLRRQ